MIVKHIPGSCLGHVLLYATFMFKGVHYNRSRRAQVVAKVAYLQNKTR